MKLFRISNLVFRICFVFLISYFEFSVISQPASAQEVSLAVSPPVVEILLAPNKKITQTFTFQSTGENLEITPELHLAIPSDSSGHMTIDPSPLVPSSIPLAFTISQNGSIYTLNLEASNTDVPQDIYLALVFRTSPLESNVSNLTSLSPAISSLILVTINPTGVMPIGLEIKDFDPPFLHDSWDPLTIHPKIENQTDIMIRPEGKYEIIAPTGKTIFSRELYPNLILGNSSRLLMSNVSNLASELTFTPPWSTLGPHRVRLVVTTQGGTKLTEVERVVWFLPLRALIITLLIALILLTVIRKQSKFKAV